MPLIFYKDSQISCSDKAFSPKKFGGPPDVFGWGFRLEVSSRWQHPEAAAIENTDKTDKTEMADARYRGRHPEAGAPISAIYYKECVQKVRPSSIAVIARRWFVRCSDGNWACVVRRRVGKGIQGACAPMAERVRRALCCGGWWSGRRSRSTRSTRMGSLTLALFLGVGAA